MTKILFNPIDENGIPLFREAQWIETTDYPQYAEQFPKVKPVERKSKRKERSDKGKPRGEYSKTGLRGSRKEAKLLHDTLKDVAKFERKEAKADHSGESKSRAERKRLQRLKLIPNPRICPHCNKPKLLSKQWVILLNKGLNSFIGCKSCLWRLKILNKGLKESESYGVSSNNCS